MEKKTGEIKVYRVKIKIGEEEYEIRVEMKMLIKHILLTISAMEPDCGKGNDCLIVEDARVIYPEDSAETIREIIEAGLKIAIEQLEDYALNKKKKLQQAWATAEQVLRKLGFN